ncbi:hypothetical protein RhiirB3_467209 [Rhizophagus irregularis]|nr:hypothetical protein RhiirB3_467209 [Rhizophagus irregularis]
MVAKPRILARDNAKTILTILKKIIENDEDSTSIIDYPVLIGSCAAKWHIPSFRDINDWDLIATISQSISIINEIKTSKTFKYIKLVYYPGGGLKIIGEFIDRYISKDESSIIFDIELVSDKFNLKKMKSNEVLDYDEIGNNDDGYFEIDKLFLKGLIILNQKQVDVFFVKYGDHPIYESLKEDKSKAWMKKSLFEKIDYQTKLNCVKEEAMAIALERYLIPMTSNNQETSYNMALVKICTTLTKGWFRQFAVDNYPQLLKLDKDLLSIANDIISKYPLKQKKKLALVPDPETQAIFNGIFPYTKDISSFDEIEVNNKICNVERSGIKITSPVNDNVSITAIITTMCKFGTECTKSTDWTASVVILPSEDLEAKS